MSFGKVGRPTRLESLLKEDLNGSTKMVLQKIEQELMEKRRAIDEQLSAIRVCIKHQE